MSKIVKAFQKMLNQAYNFAKFIITVYKLF